MIGTALVIFGLWLVAGAVAGPSVGRFLKERRERGEYPDLEGWS